MKGLAPLVATVGIITAVPSYTELNIGDKMPDYASIDVLDIQNFSRPERGPGCVFTMVIFGNRNSGPVYQALFSRHFHHIKKAGRPYGIFNFSDQVLYIDNRSKSGKNIPDGFIDEKFTMEEINRQNGRDFVDDHLGCSKKPTQLI